MGLSSEGGSGFEIEEEFVRNDEAFSSDGNSDFYDRRDFGEDDSSEDDQGGDFYEIEWDLDLQAQQQP